jgi:hypothetical protein
MDEATETELTPREKMWELHKEVVKTALALLKKKGADYAPGEDHLANFRVDGSYGICVRMQDKLARLRAFSKRKSFEVTDEGPRDTVYDIINYAVLWLDMIQTETK